ncbi:hypothetical protein [Dyadobacter sp. CY347]|uniref:hypothetical protein n=1 Tax=Dyadobacter sp. CY347 TaxID=2909336 RepID=UPI001F447E95|nr:hypothetical protein [Dyadobacter sp. CY347]MCF2487720.1 hypothetical protein [Dyadobacter sp. CY347]
MKSKFSYSTLMIVLGLGLGTSLSAFAQDDADDTHQISVVVPTVALLDLETSSVRNFSAAFTQATPLEAGDKVTAPAANSTLWLNYSSIQTAEISKKVLVETSALVPGVDINVVAAASTTGSGDKGDPTTAFNLTVAPQPLITGIGSAYTVSGPNNGHLLTYAFASNNTNYADLRSGTVTVTVKYTLADE